MSLVGQNFFRLRRRIAICDREGALGRALAIADRDALLCYIG
jgi:hypothetical protein